MADRWGRYLSAWCGGVAPASPQLRIPAAVAGARGFRRRMPGMSENPYKPPKGIEISRISRTALAFLKGTVRFAFESTITLLVAMRWIAGLTALVFVLSLAFHP